MLLARYKVLEVIGRGQYGQVFRGQDLATGQVVAIKELSLNHFSTRDFIREIQVLSRLQHPNLLSLVGVEYGPATRYIIMEYCDGGTLRDVIASPEPLSLLTKLELMIDILQGLHYLHCVDVFHCDLKPENIFLSDAVDRKVAKIGDFGSVRTDVTFRENIGDHQGLGSPAYMAPERFYGSYSKTVDLYALGIIMYETFTGDRPFLGSPNQLAQNHLTKPISPPKNLPLHLQTLVMKALEKLPQRRFQTAEEMLRSCHLSHLILMAEQRSFPDLREDLFSE
ncbi:serine/threonine-protein kinase [Lyngbya confervoides]|uniref:Serine/threonine protein kinase n=1 Tax=Lyngbya confervoides BDU141951 TaxID=1574623 RepID=A0ABD4T4V3_9CYAN|nr:serine/threonine-protein kinase [Lyngbya confervoides]MCM1983826.1 serine/threonine protein kinase [Lyngbya confervoides BDU141951]